MGTAILCAVVIGILSLVFIMLQFLIIAVITSLIKNIGKEEFKWYATLPTVSSARTQEFDSFGEMIRMGFSSTLRLGCVCFILIVIICVYVQLT